MFASSLLQALGRVRSQRQRAAADHPSASRNRVRSQPQRSAVDDLNVNEKGSLLESLPTELICQVAAWLPPGSATILSLCSHNLHDRIGQRSLRDLSQSDSCFNEQARLLQALDRDSSKTLYCFICNKLHVYLRKHEDKLGAKEMHKRVSEGRCQRGEGLYNYGTVATYHAGFKFEHIQMTMKLYRRGLLADAKTYLMHLALLQPLYGPITFMPSYMGL